ncbi:MAG: hypothetical protein WDM77_13630 [Steroidobacteraceae bacterium]
MLDMHTDMNGSAVALATLCALADLRSPLAVDGWLAITENRTGLPRMCPRMWSPPSMVSAFRSFILTLKGAWCWPTPWHWRAAPSRR